MGRNKALGWAQRPQRKEHVRVGSRGGVRVAKGGVEARGRKEARRVGEGGSQAEASHSRGLSVPRGACDLGAVPARGEIANSQHLQGSSTENATSRPRYGLPPPRLASRVPHSHHPGPVLCWVRTSGQGLESRGPPPSPWGCSATLGVGGGGCRPAKLRRPRELGLGFRPEPSGIQASGKGPLAISKKNAAGIFSASPKRQGPP